jgi:N-acetylglucosaminyldiphosphoundecaprenol N-acetyl-beta-D-mannosaminyltransferase
LTSSDAQRFSVLDVEIDALTMDGAVDELRHLVARQAADYIVFCTVSSLLSARDDPLVADAIRGAAIVTPDGMPLVWIGRRDVEAPVERVYGPDFMRAVLERLPELRHFLYGGAPGVAERVGEVLRAAYPGLRLAGSYSPPMGLAPTEVDAEGSTAIDEAKPDVVWVGIGHPKQELWMHTHAGRLNAGALAGVGAAFDFLAGTKREAPAWMKRAGLQWLHRLASEPRRLWRRYLVGNSKFLWLLAKERLRSRGARKT